MLSLCNPRCLPSPGPGSSDPDSLYVAFLSLLFTVAFFIEYTPLQCHVHIPFDLEEFYYPLADYAFQALRHGRFPQWDPTIYSGLTFAGNTRATLFYPPAWLMFVSSWRRARLSYQSVVGSGPGARMAGFLLCYLWLNRQRRLHALASALGAGVFAFSGYMLFQLQHFGLIAGYAWMPLGFSAIDAADRSRRWRPLWKLAAASALCFLAGYPPMWVVFAICMLAPAPAAARAPCAGAPAVACVLGASLLLAAVRFAARLGSRSNVSPGGAVWRLHRNRSSGFSYFLLCAELFRFWFECSVQTNPGKGLLVSGCSLARGDPSALPPPLRRLGSARRCVLGLVPVWLVDPFGVVGSLIGRSTLLSQVFSAWYFLAGVTASLALLAAIGLDGTLRRETRLGAALVNGRLHDSVAWPGRFVCWRFGWRVAKSLPFTGCPLWTRLSRPFCLDCWFSFTPARGDGFAPGRPWRR